MEKDLGLDILIITFRYCLKREHGQRTLHGLNPSRKAGDLADFPCGGERIFTPAMFEEALKV